MEEIEAPTEQVQEEIHHHAHQAHTPWISGVALSSALLAALAAVTALLSSHHANEAMIEQLQASDQWSYYQAKGIKAAVLGTRLALLEAMHKPVTQEDRQKADDYKKDQDEISRNAREKERSAESHLGHHVVLARGVTMFQVAIAVAAISVLTRKRRFWYVGLLFGIVGCAFLAQGLLISR